MSISKSVVEQVFRKHLATTGNKVDAHNRTLIELAPPFSHTMSGADYKERHRVADIVEEVKWKIDEEEKRAEGVPPIEDLVKKHWKIDVLVADLKAAVWYESEKYRIDRRIFLASYETFEGLAKDSVTEKEWSDAYDDGFEGEIVDDYIDSLAEVVAEKTGEHVYGTLEEGSVFLGQYEEGTREELEEFVRDRGEKIED